MADLALKRKPNGCYDLDFDAETNDLNVSDSLANSIVLSLGTYARERNLPVNKANLKPSRGFWADSLSVGELGGRLYEAFPGELTQESADKVKVLALEALAWLKDDGVAKSIECQANIDGKNLVLILEIAKPDGGRESFEFELNWEATNGI